MGDNETCSMVGLTGIIIQLGLGVLSFSVLILKRFRENPKRPWKIWSFDISKQLISQLVAHFINLTISIALTYDDKDSDECLWYFLTNILDNTLGVAICVGSLKLIERNLTKRRKLQYVSGNYYFKEKLHSVNYQQNDLKEKKDVQGDLVMDDTGEKIVEIEMMKVEVEKVEVEMVEEEKIDNEGQEGYLENNRINEMWIKKESVLGELLNEEIDHNDKGIREEMLDKEVVVPAIQIVVEPEPRYIILYKAWLVQLLIWNAVVIVAKCVLFGIELGLEQPLKQFLLTILGWIEAYPILELMSVIVIVPVIMNGLAYWVQDNFLMKKNINQEDEALLQESLQKGVTSEVNIV